MMVKRVASEPVPAVVGMATIGRPGASSRCGAFNARIVPPRTASTARRLSRVDRAAAAEPHDAIMLALADEGDDGIDRGGGGIRDGVGKYARGDPGRAEQRLQPASEPFPAKNRS